LLSRYPMTNAEHLLLDSTLVQRSVLRADVELHEYGPESVYCTHLAADLSAELPYPEDSDFTSFEEEQAAQIDAMLDWADEGEGTVIVLGDMNTGIEVGDASEELPANYQKFVERGWGSAFVGSPEATCTYCASNAVQGGSPDSTLPDGSTGKLIDHIFLKEGLLSTDVAQSARVLDQLQTIETEEGPKELHLSDHFGVQITLQP
jgi:endonuclease/exonuclease/phosphatase family metal-dependent hydrolase